MSSLSELASQSTPASEAHFQYRFQVQAAAHEISETHWVDG